MPQEFIWILVYILVGLCWATVTWLASKDILIDQEWDYDLPRSQGHVTNYYIIKFPWYYTLIYPDAFLTSEKIDKVKRRILVSKVPIHWPIYIDNTHISKFERPPFLYAAIFGMFLGSFWMTINIIGLIFFVPIRLLFGHR